MSEPTPLTPTEQDALVKQIGLVLLRAAPEDWRQIDTEYRATGRYFELAAEVRSADGAARAWTPPQEVAPLFARLRAGMHREGRGSWFNARYHLDHPSSYNLDFDRAEPNWQSPPPPPAYFDELRFFPRTEENVPDWLRHRLVAIQQPQAPLAPPPGTFRTARVFDGAGPSGRPAVNRPPVPEPERDRLLEYLTGAPVAVAGRGYDADVLNPDAPPVVPVAFQTDGRWVWPAAVSYYLGRYGVPPEPDLVAHARAAGFRPPEVPEDARVAAAVSLGAPPAPKGTPLPRPGDVAPPAPLTPPAAGPGGVAAVAGQAAPANRTDPADAPSAAIQSGGGLPSGAAAPSGDVVPSGAAIQPGGAIPSGAAAPSGVAIQSGAAIQSGGAIAGGPIQPGAAIPPGGAIQSSGVTTPTAPTSDHPTPADHRESPTPPASGSPAGPGLFTPAQPVGRGAEVTQTGRGGFGEPPVDQPFRTPSADTFAGPSRGAEPPFRPQPTYDQEPDQPAEAAEAPEDVREDVREGGYGRPVEHAPSDHEPRELPAEERDPAGSDTPDEALAAAGGVVASQGHADPAPDAQAADDHGRYDEVDGPRNGVRYDRGVDEDEYVAQSHADTPGVHPATEDGPPYRVSFDADSEDRFTTPPALSDPNVDLFTPQHFEAVPPWSEAGNGHVRPSGSRPERGHRYLDEDPADSAGAEQVSADAFERGADPEFDHVEPEFEDVSPTGEHLAESAFEQVSPTAEDEPPTAHARPRHDTEPASAPEPADHLGFEPEHTSSPAFTAEPTDQSGFDADSTAQSVFDAESGHPADTTYAGESTGDSEAATPESAHVSESPNVSESSQVTGSAFEHTEHDDPEFSRDHGSAADPLPESNAFHESAPSRYDEPAGHRERHPFDVESVTEPTTPGTSAFHGDDSGLFHEEPSDPGEPDDLRPAAFAPSDEPDQAPEFESAESPADRFGPDRFESAEFEPTGFHTDQVARPDEFQPDQPAADEARSHQFADADFRGEQAEPAEHSTRDENVRQVDAPAEALTGPVFGGGVSPFRDDSGQPEAAHPERREPRPIRVDEERELGLLRSALDDLDVPPGAYRFGEAADRAWCLRAVGEGWEVAWHDQGPTNPVRFDRIDDAAAYLVGRFVLAGHRHTRPTPPTIQSPPANPTSPATEPPFGTPTPPSNEVPFGTPTPPSNEVPFGTPTTQADEVPFGDPTPQADDTPFGNEPAFGSATPFGDQVPLGGPVPASGPTASGPGVSGPAFGVPAGAVPGGVNGVPEPAADLGQPGPFGQPDSPDHSDVPPPAGGAPETGRPAAGQPAIGHPLGSQPPFGQPAFGEPSQSGQPGQPGQPVFGQPAAGQAAVGHAGFGQPASNGVPDRLADEVTGGTLRPAEGVQQPDAGRPEPAAPTSPERADQGRAEGPDRSRPVVPRNGGRSGVPGGPRSWPIKPLSGEPPLTLFRHKRMIELPPGAELDRFGEAEGNLTYQAGTPFPQRSLVPSWINRSYRVYRVQRPVEALTGVAVPWFEQPGGGTAFLLPKPIEALVAEGVLVEVPAGDRPA